MKKVTQTITTTLVLGLLTVACAKKRDASLPDAEAPVVFAISEFGTLDPDQSRVTVKGHTEARLENSAQAALARNEAGVVAVDATGGRVPPRFAFMFNGLEIAGKPGQEFRIVFAVDRKAVTAYKAVDTLEGLNALERQRVTSAEEVRAEINLQKSTNADDQMTAKSFHARARETLKAARATGHGKFLVKLFSFEIQKMGRLVREKNPMGEETTKLILEKTDLASATHIKISNDAGDRKMIATDNEVYSLRALDNKLMTAGQLKDDFGVRTGLKPDARVLIRFNAEGGMVITEITTAQALGGKKSDEIKECGPEVLKALADAGIDPGALKDGCVMVPRKNHKVKFVQARQFKPSFEADRAERDKFDVATNPEDVELVLIPRETGADPDAQDPTAGGEADGGKKDGDKEAGKDPGKTPEKK